MEAAKLYSAQQNNGLGIHLGKGVGNTQPIHGAMASHKTDVCALNTRRKRELFDQIQINTGGLKTGATNGDEMRDCRG
jgi:hypothetical protein